MLDTTIHNASFKESTIIWAIICSILLHILIAVVIPNFKLEIAKKTPDLLVVELVQPKKPEPIPEPIVEKIEPIKPEPIKPEPIKPKEVKPKEIKPEPIQKPIESQPAPAIEETKPTPVQAEPQVPNVIAVEAKPNVIKTEEKPTVVAPTPPPKASDEDVGAARNAYMKSVHQELKRNHRYPKIATTRGIQGEVKVEIKFDNEGNVISAAVVESSGSDVLDEGALATVKRSNFKQFMNKILIGQLDTIIVPIVFTLVSP